MNGSIFSKLEIDVMQVSEIIEVTEFAHKYNLPAIVVHPNLTGDAIIAKSRIGAKFKIISAIDWPKGDTFGMNKLRGITIDTLEADGYEILLTPNKTEIETRNEARLLTEFVKQQIGDHIEVRFVLGVTTRSEENIVTICKGLVGIRTPSCIRNDIQNKLQQNKANPEEHNNTINKINQIVKAPIKISGNVLSIKCIAASPNAAKYGVNLIQAKSIVKEFKSQPEQLKEILN